ncbi:MAG: sarcosine oxidase subunit gamma [Pseudomonadota bacterium]
MADLALTPTGPFEGLDLPFDAGACRLTDATPDIVHSLMPLRDGTRACADALGIALPPPGQSAAAGGRRILWSGLDSWTVLGAMPQIPGAACVDISDSLAGLLLAGNGARDVLARLCPLDLHEAVFAPGATARSELAHMAAQITRTEAGFEILAARSMAQSLLHEVTDAMISVAAQS